MGIVKAQLDVDDFIAGHFEKHSIVNDLENGERAPAEITLVSTRYIRD